MKISSKRLLVLALASHILTSATLAAEGWLTDFAVAQKQAVEAKKPILIDFTGSDWCGWCKKINQETLSQAAFKKFAAEKLVLFEADFPHKKPQTPAVKKQNETLKNKHKVDGFPTFVLVSPEGKELGRIDGYLEGGPKAFMAELNKFTIKKTAAK